MTSVSAERFSERSGASAYEIRIRGAVGEEVCSAFEGMDRTLARGDTVLRGPVRDQAALYGLLERIQALGLELIEVRRL
jgi:hypothetical protein